MISLETIIVISLLLYLVQKISLFMISWIKGFYFLNSLVFLVNSYLDSGISVNTEINEFKLKSTDNKLTIEVKDGSVENVQEKLQELIDKRKRQYKLNINGQTLEITKG